MAAHIRQWLSPPLFAGDERKTRQANILNFTLLMGAVLSLLLLASELLTAQLHPALIGIDSFGLGFALICREMLRRGFVRQVGISLLVVSLVGLAVANIVLGTVRAPNIAGYLLVIVSASLLVSERGLMVTVVVCGLSIGGLLWAEAEGVITPLTQVNEAMQWLELLAWLLAAAGLSYWGLRLTQTALDRAEQEIAARRIAESQLQEAQTIARLGNWAWDVRAETLTWSDEVYRIFGVTPGELSVSAEAFENFLHPADRADFLQRRAELLATTGRAVIDHRILRRDGIVRWVQERAQVTVDALGQTARIMGTVQDITERKLAEQLLADSEQRYHSLFDATHAVKLLLDPATGDIVDANTAAADYYGYPLAQLKTLRVMDLSGLSTEAVGERLALSASQKRTYFNARHRLASGEIRDVEVYVGPLELGGRQLLHALVHDITERKHVEERLRRSEEQLREAQHLAHLGNWEWDLGTHTLTWSDELYRILGLEPRQISPSADTFERFLLPDDRADFVRRRTQLMADGQAFTVEHRVCRSSGEVRWVQERAQVRLSPDGQPTHITGTVQDITEYKQAEAALHASDLNFRTFFDTIDHLLFVLDEQGRILFTNAAVSNRLGYSPDDLRGQNVLMVHPPERRAEAGRIVADMLAGHVEYCPVPVQASDGRQYPVETRVVAGQWNGRPALFGVTKDLSSLKASEEKFAKAFDASPLLMALSDLETGCYLDVNAAFLTTLGYERADIIGRTASDLSLFQDQAQRNIALQRIAQQGYLRDFEIRVVTRTNQVRYGAFAAEVLQLQDRRVLLTIMNDITERYQMEDALREQQAKLTALIENSADAIWSIDTHGRLIVGNAVFLRVARTAIGRDLQPGESLVGDDLPVNYVAFWRAQFERVLRGEQFMIEFVAQYAGVDYWQDCRLSPISAADGRILGATISSRDISGRKRLEQDLYQSEATLRALLNATDEAITLVEPDGRVIAVNDVMAQRMGQTAATMLGCNLFDYMPPAVAARRRQWAAQVVASGQRLHQVDENGGHWLDTVATPVFDAVRQLSSVAIFTRDITARKQMEDALRDSEAKFRAIIEQSSDGILLIDEQGLLIEWNRALEQMTGLLRANVLGQPAWDIQARFIPPEHRTQSTVEQVKISLRNILATGQLPPPGQPTELVIQHASGELRIILQNAFPIQTDKGYRLGIISHDITERKRMEQALRESQALYRSLIEILPICICRKDLAGRFTFVNQRFLDETHIALPDLLGKTDFDIHPLELARKYQRDEQAVIATGQLQELIEERTLLNGESIIVQTVKTPVRDDLGRIIGIQASFWDITARQRAEAELRKLNAVLEQRVAERTAELKSANQHLTELDRLKDEFMSRISHELRTPLAGLLFALELLEVGKPEKRERYLERVKHDANRLRVLIEDVLQFSEINLPVEQLDLSAIDLNQLIETRQNSWCKISPRTGVHFQLALTPHLPSVRADREFLVQALTRLVTNALSYTSAGAVTLATAQLVEGEQQWVTICVKDTGPGITPEDLPHIFERFYRGRAAADYTVPGTGIGLTISHEIAKKLGGRLTVETQVDIGSTFTLWLPAA